MKTTAENQSCEGVSELCSNSHPVSQPVALPAFMAPVSPRPVTLFRDGVGNPPSMRDTEVQHLKSGKSKLNNFPCNNVPPSLSPSAPKERNLTNSYHNDKYRCENKPMQWCFFFSPTKCLLLVKLGLLPNEFNFYSGSSAEKPVSGAKKVKEILKEEATKVQCKLQNLRTYLTSSVGKRRIRLVLEAGVRGVMMFLTTVGICKLYNHLNFELQLSPQQTPLTSNPSGSLSSDMKVFANGIPLSKRLTEYTARGRELSQNLWIQIGEASFVALTRTSDLLGGFFHLIQYATERVRQSSRLHNAPGTEGSYSLEGMDVDYVIEMINIFNSILNALLTALSVVSFCALVGAFYQMYGQGGASGGRLGTSKKSRLAQWVEWVWCWVQGKEHRTLCKVKNPLCFSSVVGHTKTKEELLQIADLLQRPVYYAARGVRCPRGILLEGPSGSGKTLLAKALAAEIAVPFIHYTASSFVEMYVGRGAQRVREAFSEARSLAPCVVFLDEVDALGLSRSATSNSNFGSSGQEYVQTVNQLLVEIDGITDNAHALISQHTGIFDKNEQRSSERAAIEQELRSSLVVVIAATNRIDAVDSALKRPGRFDKVIHVPPPTEVERLGILKLYADRISNRASLNLDLIATHLMDISIFGSEFPQGPELIHLAWTGADIECMVNEATLGSLRRPNGVLEQGDLEMSCMTINERKLNEFRNLTQTKKGNLLQDFAHLFDSS